MQGYRYFPAAEDYDFLMRVLDSGYRIANVPEPLVLYRIHSASMTSGLTKIQYDVKNYILLLHQQRMQKGSDDYSEQVCVAMKAKMNQSSPSWASVLVTKARAAEESKKMIPLVFWGALALLFSGAGISRLKSLLGYQYIKWRYEQ